MIPYDLKLILRWCDQHDRRGYNLRKDVLAVQFETFVHSVRGMAAADLKRQEKTT